jgi:pimeloyl-ACP methyl ester carboxylesterase
MVSHAVPLSYSYPFVSFQAMDLFDLSDGFPSMKESLTRIKSPTMIIGIQTDVLIPVQQQRKLAKMLTDAGKGFVVADFSLKLLSTSLFAVDVIQCSAYFKLKSL